MSNETERPSRRFFGLGNFVPRAILYLKGDKGDTGATGATGPTGPQGPKGDPQTPYSGTPQMDGEGAAGTATTYARGDHRHPTDTTRQAVIEDLASIRSGAAAGATAVQPSALSRYRTATAQDAIDGALDEAIAAKYTKPATGIPAGDLAAGVIPTVPTLPLSIENGGTGATSKNAALANLGAVKKSGDTMTGDLEVTRTSGSYTGGTVSVRSVPDGSGEALVKVAATDGAELYLDAASGYNPSIAVKRAGGELKEIEVPNNSGTLALQEGIAPAFSSSSTYAVGDYVTYEGLLYKCTTAVSTAGAWDATKWTAVTSTGELNAVKATIPAAQEQSNWNETNRSSKAYIQNKPEHIVEFQNNNNGGSDFKALTIGNRYSGSLRGQPSLAVGNYTKASGINSFAQGYSTDATAYNAHAEGNSTSATNDAAHAEGNATTASGNTAHAEGYQTTAAGNISHAEGISTYAAGRPSHAEGSETTAAGIASHADGYRAVTAASGNGSGASSPHDYAFAWQGVSTGGYYRSHGAGTYNVNPVGGIGGFYVGEDSLASLLRYAFAAPTPSVSGTSATVACEDRAINDFTVATGITSLTITPPAAVTGRARDFFCRVTLTDASLPTVTLSGATIDIGSTEVAGMTQGVNLLMFTEISAGHWLASRRSAS